jgi:hypothetical protein
MIGWLVSAIASRKRRSVERRSVERRSVERRGRFQPRFETLFERVNFAGGLLPSFDIGSPTVTDLWVDPAGGSDTNAGTSRLAAFRTLTAAWNRVPINTPLTSGFRINLVAGTYPESAVPNYWESRHGTAAAPVILQAVDGAGTARLPNINMFDCQYVYMIGLHLSAGGGDVLHLEACEYILIRDTTIQGLGDINNYNSPQEALKANQSQHLYIENSDISGGYDNAVDFVAVQYGHVVGSKIHRAVDWAMYAKGGSAYLTIAGNEFYDAGTGGFTAGQGTGFEFMSAPWLHYEAYDIQFVNNVVRNVEGAGIGVNGGYNILMAYNTLYDVGARSHVIEVVHGGRTCDGNTTQCAARLAQGGWGTSTTGGDEPIPDRNVYIYNNVIYNPDGNESQWQHFEIGAPRTPGSRSNIPSPSRTDVNLRIAGNLIWNGPASHPLGIADATLADQVSRDNTINSVRPVFVDALNGDYRLASGFAPPASVAIPSFSWSDAPTVPAVPAGRTSTAVGYDFDGAARAVFSRIGAYALTGENSTPVDLSAAFSPLSGIALGASLSVTVTIVNAGTNPAPAARIDIPAWPATLTVASSTPSQGSTTVSAAGLGWTVGELAVGASATLVLTLTPRVAGTLTLNAVASSSGLEATPLNNNATATAVVSPTVRSGIFAVGTDSGGPTRVRVYDATTRVERFTLSPYVSTFKGGVRVAVADVTGDGVSDIITAPGPGMAAMVRVFDGRDGTPLAGTLGQFLALDRSTLRSGIFVAAADVNADGRADVIVGTDAGLRAQVRVYSGASGTLLQTIAPYGTFAGGVRVAAADVDGDGRAEVITAPGRGLAPTVKAFNALTGANLWSFNAGLASYRGGLFVSAADVDGDGRSDIVVGTGTGGAATVRIYRGSDRQLLSQFTAFETSVTGGVRVALLDLDGDGRADPITGTAPGVAPRIVLRTGTGMTVLATMNPFVSPIKGTFVAAGYTS